jgi:formylglycine-generating enzyme required for sulfatase activity
MGSPLTEKGRGTDEGQQRVTILTPFLISRTVVTKAEWKTVMKTEPWKGQRCVVDGDDAPAVYVDWHDAVAFCRKLTVQERAGGWLEKGEHYRLPTEAEWEYAARAGTTGDRHGPLDDVAWYGDNSGSKTHRVGTKRANAWGLHDTMGNVWEWTQDWYGDYSGAAADPQGPASGVFRVIRGGAWDQLPRTLRSSWRDWGLSHSH